MAVSLWYFSFLYTHTHAHTPNLLHILFIIYITYNLVAYFFQLMCQTIFLTKLVLGDNNIYKALFFTSDKKCQSL